MLRLFFDMGLRRSSIVYLDIEDVDLKENRIKIFLKGRREKRIKDIPEPTQKALDNWLNIRYEVKGPLFINMDRNRKNRGKRITGSGVYSIIQRLSEKVGKRTRPHGLRHLAITEAIKETARRGMPISEVTKFSDHASVSTLMIYNDGIDGIQGKISTWVSSLV
jgi:integrase/recombinase XerC